jgi:S-adenosylmethionine:tRNA ribosyltransferase-isomerase
MTPMDRERYQTIYARVPGAIAAPTAGLHLTADLLDGCREKGVHVARVTLHVGPGTFQPVKTERVEDHQMEVERYEIPEDTAALIERVQLDGGRVVAVGSTVVRALETAGEAGGRVESGPGRSCLFITPPYEFRVVDALLTNFHLPCSTLLMMVTALAGRDLVRRAYAEAVAREYRFYSYGDCMLIV